MLWYVVVCLTCSAMLCYDMLRNVACENVMPLDVMLWTTNGSITASLRGHLIFQRSSSSDLHFPRQHHGPPSASPLPIGAPEDWPGSWPRPEKWSCSGEHSFTECTNIQKETTEHNVSRLSSVGRASD